MAEQLKAFFQPDGVVVIGASREKNKLGYGVARNLIASKYPGKIALINPKGGELFGHEMYKTLDDVEFEVDLAIVVVPAKFVPDTLVACSQKNIKSIIIITGGFREVGGEGLVLEERCREIAEEHGLRILGPNCIGVVDTHSPLDTTFIQPPMPEPGEVAFISQSGALGAALIDWARGEGFGFSQVVSLGNQLDVSEADMLLAVGTSDHTSVITLYLESVQNGQTFMNNASEVSKNKPVLAVKVGRSEAGKQAASSHTGALAGSNAAYDAALRKCGVIRAETTEEMFEWAKVLAWSPGLPERGRVAILTNAGGPGVTATDAVEREGLEMAELSEKTLNALGAILPSAASTLNPVDMLASASPEIYAQCLGILLEDPNVDMVLVIAPPPPMFESLDIAKSMLPVISATNKPVVVSFMGSTLVSDAIAYLREHKVPEYGFPERAVRAMAVLRSYAKVKSRDQEVLSAEIQDQVKQKVKTILGEFHGREGFIPANSTTQVMELYDIPVLGLELAKTEEQAVAIAEKVGYPLVMKIASDSFSHKSDLGGVFLNLESEDDVRTAYRKMDDIIQEAEISDLVDGVFLQRMIPAGQEVIVGAGRDPVFGPLLMFGSGGVEVEGLQDVQFSTIPPAAHEINYLLENTWAGKKLEGFRNFKRADISALQQIFVRLSQLMLDFPEIREVEINPVIVLDEGQGAFAVDARMLL